MPFSFLCFGPRPGKCSPWSSCQSPPRDKGNKELLEWLRKHPEFLATCWYRWSKLGRADVLQAAHDLVLAEGIPLLHSGKLDSNKALYSLKDANDPAELLRHLINSKSSYGRTPLIAATKAGHLDTVKLLLSWGADVWYRDKLYHMNALTYACSKGNTECARLLVESLPDWDQRTRYVDATALCSVTSLHLACWGGHTETVKLLLQFGPNINAKVRADCYVAHAMLDAKCTPLHVAAAKARLGCAKEIMRHYAARRLGGAGLVDPRFVRLHRTLPFQMVNPELQKELSALLNPATDLELLFPDIAPEPMGVPRLALIAAQVARASLLQALDCAKSESAATSRQASFGGHGSANPSIRGGTGALMHTSGSGRASDHGIWDDGRGSNWAAGDAVDYEARGGVHVAAGSGVQVQELSDDDAGTDSDEEGREEEGQGEGKEGWVAPCNAASSCSVSAMGGPAASEPQQPAGCGSIGSIGASAHASISFDPEHAPAKSPPECMPRGPTADSADVAGSSSSSPQVVQAGYPTGRPPRAPGPAKSGSSGDLSGLCRHTPHARPGHKPKPRQLSRLASSSSSGPQPAAVAAPGSAPSHGAACLAPDMPTATGQFGRHSLPTPHELSRQGSIHPDATATHVNMLFSSQGGTRPGDVHEDEDEDSTCGICFAAETDTAFVKCGHRVCSGCAKHLLLQMQLAPVLCPYCRGVVRGFVSVPRNCSRAGAVA